MEKQDLLELLKGNPYPGRGIVLGKNTGGGHAVAVYFIMGRSENSRNRIFTPTEDGIRTEAHDPARMTDPSLITYTPARASSSPTATRRTPSGTTSWRAAPSPRR